jgi:hypothetical protein
LAKQLDSTGSEIGRRVFKLDPLQHFASNINEPPLFEGTQEYEGTIEFQSTSPVVPVALRQDGFVTTSTPVFPGQRMVGPMSQNPLPPTGKTIAGPGFADVDEQVDLWSSRLYDTPGQGVAPKPSPKDICFTFSFVDRDPQGVLIQVYFRRDDLVDIGAVKVFDEIVSANSTRTWCFDNAYWLRVSARESGEAPKFFWRVDEVPVPQPAPAE